MTVTRKKMVSDMSGFCRHSGFHEMCRGMWETPSAIVTCACACHQAAGNPLTPAPGPGLLVPKGVPVQAPIAGLTPKK